VTVQRVVYEERVEQVPVRVCRMITETKTVQEPKTIVTWKPYQINECLPRTVPLQVPADSCTIYGAPANGSAVSRPAESSSGSAATTKRVPLPEGNGSSVLKKEKAQEPKPADARPDGAPAEPADKSAASAEKAQSAPKAGAEEVKSEPKDTDPTGKPELDPAEGLKLLQPPAPPTRKDAAASDKPA
jgi:hypothetical protein